LPDTLLPLLFNEFVKSTFAANRCIYIFAATIQNYDKHYITRWLSEAI